MPPLLAQDPLDALQRSGTLGWQQVFALAVAVACEPWALAVIAVALYSWLERGVPAVLKARVGAHEVITTMMFTYIGRYIVSWLVTGPLRAPGTTPQRPRRKMRRPRRPF